VTVPKAASIPLPVADAGLDRISAHFAARLDAEHRLPSFRGVPRATRDAARRFWSQRAWSEYCALPVVSQILLKLVDDGAPLADLSSAAGVLHDESLHTALSVQVADAFGGYVEDVPSYLSYEAGNLSAPSTMPLVVWLLIGCCVGETVSRALIQARLKRTRHPALRAIVARTLKDENVHVAFGWAAARRAVRALEPEERDVMVPWCQSALEGMWHGPSTLRINRPGQAIERRLRQRVADAGLGSCSPDEENAVVGRCVDDFIVPGFHKLGVKVPPRNR
jgi:hypothetical protein